jgi:hypothetical protein
MPSVRKMTAAEIARVEAKKAAQEKSYALAYEEIGRELIAGDEIELELDPEEVAAVAISHLEQAVTQLNPPLRLIFQTSDDPLLLKFQAVLLNPPARPAPAPADLFEFDEPQPRFGSAGHRGTNPGNRKQRGDRPSSASRTDRSEPRKPRNQNPAGGEQRRNKPERQQWQGNGNGQNSPQQPTQRARRRTR